MSNLESHPFPPFYPEGARLLMMGTFPPQQAKWSMDFYYPNFINDMWRIFGLIFFNDSEFLVDKAHKTFHLERIIDLLKEKKIALNDTGVEVIRQKDNASDKFLQIEKPIDISNVLIKLPDCVAVATTGEKAAGVIAELTDSSLPKVGEHVNLDITLKDGSQRKIEHWRMPSSSRAYPLKLEKKAEYYRNMLKSLSILD